MSTLDDYQSGFLGEGEGGAGDLLKAMQAGQITGRDTTNLSLTAEPLKAESLETTLKLLEFRQKDIRLFNAMPKLTAYNTVEEFLQLESYGANRGGFYNEGELSDVEDSKYVRRAEHIKYIQITGEITMQAQMTRNYVDVYKKEVENKVMWVTRTANEALTKANSSVIPQEWNSLYTQHASIGSSTGNLYQTLEDYYTSNVVIDLRGKSLTQEDVEMAAVIVDDNFGGVSDLFAPTSVISALSQDYFKDQRIMMNAPSAGSYNGVIGTVAKGIDTTIGTVALQPDKFMKHNFNSGRTLADPSTSAKAPSAPVAGTNPAVVVDGLSKYKTGEVGTVYYAVAAKNRSGESNLTLLNSSAVTLVVGSAVDLTFTAGVGANATNGYVVYRTEVTSAGSATGVPFYPIFEISTAELATGYDGAVATKVRDRGRKLPNTEEAFLTEMVDDVLSFKQLAPISKLDLATLSMSKRFITFMFGTPSLYTPKKLIKFVNCGKKLTA
jgi:hypothetical protein